MTEKRPICPGCREEIDPDTCKCGESRSGQCDNHNFSSVGCRCWEKSLEELTAPMTTPEKGRAK